MGVLGPDRVMLVSPQSNQPKIPTDLSGVTLIMWSMHSSGDLRPSLGPAITEMKLKIGALV